MLGTIGVGALVQRFPLALEVLRWGGVVYLVWFAIQSVRQAIKPTGLHADAPASATSVVATTLALTYLNPHVYLDTVVMLGNIANQQGDGRWWFAGGAALVGSGLARGADNSDPSSLRFPQPPHRIEHYQQVSPGHHGQVLIRWGDKVLAAAPAFDPRQQSGQGLAAFALRRWQAANNRTADGYLTGDLADELIRRGG